MKLPPFFSREKMWSTKIKWKQNQKPSLHNTGKNNGFPILDILGYFKNPKFGKVRQIPIREFPTKFPIGICLTLPNLGFLWVFFKYPKKSKIGNPLFFPMQNTEILWILIHIYRAKHKCKWYTLYLTDCGNQMVESVIQRTCISTSSLWRHYWSNLTQTFAFTQMLKRVLCLNNENRKLQLD